MRILSFPIFFLLLVSASVFSQQKFAFLPKEFRLMAGDLAKMVISDPKINVDVYTDDGTKLSSSQLRKITMADFSQLVFADDKQRLRAIVLQKMTDEERADRLELASKLMSEKNGIKHLTGTAAPDFEFTDLNGKTIRLVDLKGKTVVLNFWYVQCSPCIAEMPKLNKFAKKYASENVVFYGISYNDIKTLHHFLEVHAFDYNIGSAPIEAIRKHFDVRFYPMHLVIDATGKIIFDSVGNDDLKALEKAIRIALGA